MDKPASVADIKVIDTDSHVTEPPDLWTSRVPKAMRDAVPRVETHPTTGKSHWRIGDHWLLPVGHYARAGWPEYPPSSPKELHEVDPGSWQGPARLERMDQYGIHAQVLYPNIIAFEGPLFSRLDPEVSLACARAYNDFLVEFASADPDRLLPIAMIPYWDVTQSVKEMERARGLGHKGVIFANKFEEIGLPGFTDPHWDDFYAAAQDLDLSVNFHIGFSAYSDGLSQEIKRRRAKPKSEPAATSPAAASPNTDPFMEHFDPRSATKNVVVSMMQAVEPIARILTTGICDRFPRVKFVSVESGFGYLPFLLESLDWHWKGYGAHRKYPMLPSEYFRRQCYGSFWFETTTLPLLQLYPDNFMFETDYPHPTGMSPGPASPAENPADHIARHFAGLPPDLARKVLHDNAARLYHVN